MSACEANYDALVTGSATDIAAFQALMQQAKSQALYQKNLDVAALRAGAHAFAGSALARKPPEGIEMEHVDVEGISSAWLREPYESRHFSLLYLHGGGYVGGSLQASAGVAASFCMALQCPVLAVNYRQAPEHPFPAALSDVLTASHWLATNRPGPIFLGGDSAGGGLAVAAALALAESGARHADGVIAISGVLDLTLSSTTWQSNADSDLISPALAPVLYDLYLNGADPRDPRASPVFADLRHLPPTMLVAGGAECLLGDSQLLARAARAQGRQVQFEVYEAMPHNFVKFVNPIADLAFHRIGAWARMHFPQLYG